MSLEQFSYCLMPWIQNIVGSFVFLGTFFHLLLFLQNATSSSLTFTSAKETAAQRCEMAAVVSTTKILTDEDFKRIDAAQIRKQVTSAKRRRIVEPEMKK